MNDLSPQRSRMRHRLFLTHLLKVIGGTFGRTRRGRSTPPRPQPFFFLLIFGRIGFLDGDGLDGFVKIFAADRYRPTIATKLLIPLLQTLGGKPHDLVQGGSVRLTGQDAIRQAIFHPGRDFPQGHQPGNLPAPLQRMELALERIPGFAVLWRRQQQLSLDLHFQQRGFGLLKEHLDDFLVARLVRCPITQDLSAQALRNIRLGFRYRGFLFNCGLLRHLLRFDRWLVSCRWHHAFHFFSAHHGLILNEESALPKQGIISRCQLALGIGIAMPACQQETRQGCHSLGEHVQGILD